MIIVSKLKTFGTNLKILWNDVSFNRSVKMFGVVIAMALAVFALLWFLGVGIKAEVYQGKTGGHPMKFLEYAFCVLGAIDGNPEAQPVYAVYAASVRLAGAILIGGVITSFLCTLLDRYSDMTLHGLMYRKLSGHTVIVGYGVITDDFIRRVLGDREDFESWFPDRPLFEEHKSPFGKVLLYTSDDVVKVRESLTNLLPKKFVKNIEFVSGEMDIASQPDKICDRLCLKEARRVFVLGDYVDAGAGELRNLNFARVMVEYLRERLPEGNNPFPIYVQMENSCSFDTVKKMDCGFDARKVMLIPFSMAEGWARSVWGDIASKYEPLDFRPLQKGDYVHLIVGGLSDFGRALAIEAIRVAHYASGEQTRITLVDPQPARWRGLVSSYPGLDLLPDMEIKYVADDLQSHAVRELLAAEARNPHCLLTVAVCDASPDVALASALNLPREIYPGSPTCPRERVPRVLVRQEHGDAKTAGWDPGRLLPGAGTRYACVQPFGWQEQGVPTWCLQRFSVLAGSWFYRHKNWEDVFVKERGENVDLDAMRRESFDLYKVKQMSLLWANVYTIDHLATVLRQLGLKAVRSGTAQDFRDALDSSIAAWNMLQGPRLREFARAEHYRWMADRVLMGYLPHPERPTKDDTYRWHDCLVEFDKLSEENVRKDESSVKCRIFTLAMMGFHIEPLHEPITNIASERF